MLSGTALQLSAMNFPAEKRWKREKTHRFEKKWEDMKKATNLC
jgi:hypothetical protein